MSALVAVATFGNHVEAELAKGALRAAGIPSSIASDDAGGQNPQLGFSRGVVVMVTEGDAEAARDILAQPAPHTPDRTAE